MKAVVPNFSARYLRQVQEEWLYVQSIRESQGNVRIIRDPVSGKVAYPPNVSAVSRNGAPPR